MVYSILDHGAVPGGKTLCTDAIQATVDLCAANGGGTVEVPAGTYLTGSVFLRSHVELRLSHGATLLASDDLDDYNALDAYPGNDSCASEQWCGKHLLICYGCHDVAVTGTGTFDGNGEAFYKDPQPFSPYCWEHGIRWSKNGTRPGQLLVFSNSDDVTLTDFTVRNATCWSCYLTGCDRVSIRGLKIYNHIAAANTDGIDVELSRFVTISDCVIDTGDDCITFRCSRGNENDPRTTRDQCTEFVTVTNCVLASSASVFRVGVGSDLIRHVRVSDCVISRGSVGIHLMTGYNGCGASKIEDVSFRSLTASGIAFPVVIEGERGYVRSVGISDYRAACSASLSVIGGWTADDGLPGVSDISFRDVDLTFEDREEVTPAMQARRGETALIFAGVKDLRVDDLRVRAVPGTWKKTFSVTNCPDASFANCVLPDPGSGQ